MNRLHHITQQLIPSPAAAQSSVLSLNSVDTNEKASDKIKGYLKREEYQILRNAKKGNLKGKTLFITGASRGIGLAIALRAAQDGANIVVAAKTVKNDPRLPGTIYTAAEEIEKAGGKALPIQ